MINLPAIKTLVARGALFVVNHSGGKDSQAMLIKLLTMVPRHQILVVHASLGEVEWKGAKEHAHMQAVYAGLEFIVATARHKDGTEKTFFTMAERKFAADPTKPCFPTAKYRQCTSDLKRGPIEREIIKVMKDRRLNLVVNCEGIRADESAQRSKYKPFEVRKGQLSKAGREAYNWLPIFDLTTAEVFQTIADADQKPHWAYQAGNERLSCVFCIFGSKNDLALGAKHNPELFAKWNELEERTGYTLHMSRKTLKQLVAEAQAAV